MSRKSATASLAALDASLKKHGVARRSSRAGAPQQTAPHHHMDDSRSPSSNPRRRRSSLSSSSARSTHSSSSSHGLRMPAAAPSSASTHRNRVGRTTRSSPSSHSYSHSYSHSHSYDSPSPAFSLGSGSDSEDFEADYRLSDPTDYSDDEYDNIEVSRPIRASHAAPATTRVRQQLTRLASSDADDDAEDSDDEYSLRIPKGSSSHSSSSYSSSARRHQHSHNSHHPRRPVSSRHSSGRVRLHRSRQYSEASTAAEEAQLTPRSIRFKDSKSALRYPKSRSLSNRLDDVAQLALTLQQRMTIAASTDESSGSEYASASGSPANRSSRHAAVRVSSRAMHSSTSHRLSHSPPRRSSRATSSSVVSSSRSVPDRKHSNRPKRLTVGASRTSTSRSSEVQSPLGALARDCADLSPSGTLSPFSQLLNNPHARRQASSKRRIIGLRR
jgi:hypothetical protein